MNRAAFQRFRNQLAAKRQELWPATITTAAGASVDCAKSPTKTERVLQEQGAGWVQRALATFSFAATDSFQPAIGAEFTLTSSTSSAESGTVWRVFKVSDPSAVADCLVQCFRLD